MYRDEKQAYWGSDGPLTTTYSYNDGTGGTPYTGERIKVDYSDATPDVEYGYDRLGRLDWVKDAAGTREFDYDATTLAQTTESFVVDGSTPDLFDGKVLTTLYEDGGETNGLPGRFKGVQVGTGVDPDSDYEAVYGYDVVARIGAVAGPGLPSAGAVYGYYVNGADKADLVTSLEFKTGGTVRFKTAWTYEAQRDLVTSVTNTWYDKTGSNPRIVSQYDYGYDARSQRTYKQRSGAAFSATWYEAYAYNDRGELVTSDYHKAVYPNQNNSPADDRVYHYDPIGNRTDMMPGTSATVYYCANQLNQYTFTDDAAGTCPDPPTPTESFGYDADGNLISDSGSGGSPALVYEYDAENRLTAVYPASPTTGDKKVAFTYDYQHRRVEKRVYDWDPQAGGGQGDWSATPSSRRRFVWDGWLMLLELDGLGSNAVLRKYTWGLDLAGQREGRSREAAGGIGGLLAVRDEEAGLLGAEYVYAYDAAGNVGQLVNLWVLTWNADGVMKARYEYDPYGNVTSEAGTYAATNRIRFSTKYFDAETGLGYWGRRYYRPDIGRWLNRDPIDETGGENLYAYVRNRPIHQTDRDGLMSVSDCNKCIAELSANDPLVKGLIDCAKKVPPGRHFPCFGNASCFYCLGNAGGWYNPCRLSGDIGICANNASSCDDVRDTLVHELVRAITMCRRFFPRSWKKLDFGNNRCQRCLVHELLAYEHAGLCATFEECLRMAERSCRMSLSCIGNIDKDKQWVRDNWGKRWKGGYPYVEDYCDELLEEQADNDVQTAAR